MTKVSSLLHVLVLAALLMAGTPAWAESDRPTAPAETALPDTGEGAGERSDEEAEPGTNAPAAIVYVPPARGSVRASAAGGIRGGTTAFPRPVVLAPDHVALTEREAPSLFWYVDRVPPTDTLVSFTLIRADRIDPVAERALPGTTRAGIQRIRLSELGVTLEPGVKYEWSIAVTVDPNDRSRDLVSMGWLRRVGGAKALEGDRDARAYAERSLWYDALEAISDELDATPADATLRAQRDALLRQANLP
jgi:hypothetical protein